MEGCRLAVNDLACRRGERVLFRELSFELNPGEALQVVGPNGTGKSSLLRIVAGLLRPFAGTVEGEGSLGLVDERPALDEHLPLGRALAFWGRIDGGGFIERESASDRFGLSGVLDVPVQYLSTGQRKRAALARLLGQQAAVWLLDEPLNGLDAATARECERLVADHCRAGGIALIASHQPFEVAGLRTIAIAEYAP
jgi:heme exporter protein A